MVILPIGYLFWWKKSRHLLLGTVVLVVLLIVGLILPGKLAFSILERELKTVERKFKKEGWAERGKDEERRSWQKLEEALKNTLRQEITPKNQEKIALEKEIIKWREEIEKAKQEEQELEKEKRKYFNNFSLAAIKAEEKIRKKLKEEVYPRMAKGYKMSYEKGWE